MTASIFKCRSCKSSKLIDIFALGDQYLSDFVLQSTKKKPENYPLALVLCGDCTLLQLKHTTPPSSLYHDRYGYYSGISSTIRADLKDVVKNALSRVNPSSDDILVDIGSNDATLLKYYTSLYQRVGFDPVSKFKKYYDEPNLSFVNDYFSYRSFSGRFPKQKAKVITVISCFYDLDDPNSFVEDLQKTLASDGLLIIQQNYLVGMLKQNAIDNVVHEHLEYYSLTSLTKLLNRHGLDVVDAQVNDINGGSFRVYVRHMDTLKKMRLVEAKMKLHDRWTYYLFGMRVNQARKHLYEFVKKVTDEGKKVYLYGASTRVNTLLQYAGLDNKLLTAAVERNPDKFGKKIASIDLPIISEEQARKEKPDYMLVGPWFFREEICKREEEYVRNGGALLFPLPELYIYDQDKLRDSIGTPKGS